MILQKQKIIDFLKQGQKDQVAESELVFEIAAKKKILNLMMMIVMMVVMMIVMMKIFRELFPIMN